jgi:hypothetical protein
MPRIIVAAFIALFVVSCAVAGDSRPGCTINLDQPGVLEALQHDNPAHYQKIQEIMAGLFGRSDSEVPRWIQTTFNAHDVSYTPVLLTTDPPQRHLSFTLDNTSYRAVVTLTHLKPEIIPVK